MYFFVFLQEVDFPVSYHKDKDSFVASKTHNALYLLNPKLFLGIISSVQISPLSCNRYKLGNKSNYATY